MKHLHLHRIISLLTPLPFAATFCLAPAPARATAQDDFAATNATVGHAADGSLVTPVNQTVTPAGKVIALPGTRPQALALSPNGKILVVAGLASKLTVIDPATGEILETVRFPDANRDTGAQAAIAQEILNPNKRPAMSLAGLAFSPDGTRLYLSSSFGDIKAFSVTPAGKVAPLRSFALPPAGAPERNEEIPAGLALSPDGKKLYVACNLANRLVELDTATGAVLRIWDTGVAPCDVVLAKNKLYVANWGGRRPDPGATLTSANPVGPAGRGTTVRVDARGIASEGTLTIIDLAQSTAAANAAAGAAAPSGIPHSTIRIPQSGDEVALGRHTSALALSPDARWLVAAATADDTLYVIDTRTGEIAEKICARANPGDPFGAQPTALAFAPDGKTLYAANGTQNAIAVFRFDPADKETTHLGLIPAGWFPNGLAYDARRNQLCVSNMKDIVTDPEKSGDQSPAADPANPATGYKTKQFAGTLQLIPIPANATTAAELAAHTARALANLRAPLLAQAALPPRPGRAPAPVPERAGEPSVFKHVLYIIKENRTYDQVLGDIPAGNGDPALCIYGENVTPNLHKLAREFVLLDNTYCSGAQSADGHNWSDSAIATDYVERQAASGWPRSYPSGGGPPFADALAYAPTGFIWDNALSHGKTVINYGEHCTPNPHHWKDPARKAPIGFAEHYANYITRADAIAYGCEPDIEPMRPICDLTYPGCDWPVPDQVRADHFIRALKNYEQNDNLPALIILWIPNDHTNATKPGMPAPEAMMADNDLAVGRVIEALSRTKYWRDTCVLAIEDDSQSGWDHVSGYRTTAYAVSAYTKRGATVSTQYNQTSLLRTIELILGLPPMNQMDATATPMFDCFTATPDFTPFTAVPNKIPLDKMNPSNLKKIPNKKQRADAQASAKLPLDKVDQCDEDTLNRLLWRAAKGYAVAYPDWAVKPARDDD